MNGIPIVIAKALAEARRLAQDAKKMSGAHTEAVRADTEQSITDLEIDNIEQEQSITDLEIAIYELKEG